jgi:hypothetical protein
MAIQYVSSSYTTVTSGDATWQVAYPSGTQAGDILILAAVYSVVTLSNRDGFTTLEAVENTSSRAVLLYKIADGADSDADLTFSETTNGVAIMLAFRNVDSIGDSTANSQTSAGTTNATDTITGISTGSTAVAFFIATDDTTTCTHTQPSGYDEVQDRSSNASLFDRSMSANYKLNAASSEAPSANASTTVDQRIAFLITLVPEVSSGMFLGFSF